MGFSLQNLEYEKIKALFCDFPNLLNKNFEVRMKKALSVLHFAYLWGACRETEKALTKYKKDDLYEFIMQLYAKRIKTHQANFLLLRYFENALRSTLCVKIANFYNKDNGDSWFIDQTSNSSSSKVVTKLLQIRTKHLKNKKAKNSWEIFDCFCLG